MVIHSYKVRVSGIYPTHLRMSFSFSVTGRHGKLTLPLSILMRLRTDLMSVLLPAPFCPIKPTIEPEGTCKLMPVNAKSVYFLDRSIISSAGFFIISSFIIRVLFAFNLARLFRRPDRAVKTRREYRR